MSRQYIVKQTINHSGAANSPNKGSRWEERLSSGTDAIRATARWLLTVVAALGSVLVAGLRFGDVGRIPPGSTAFKFAVTGGVLGLLGLGTIVFFASQVLLSHYNSLIAVLDQADEAERGERPLPAYLTNKMIRALEEEGDYLYRGAANDCRDLFKQIRDADKELAKSWHAKTTPATSDPWSRGLTPPAEALLRARRVELEEASQRVIDFADHWVTRQRFHQLVIALLAGGFVTAAGVFTFALGVNAPEASRVEVKNQPVPVHVYLTESGRAWAVQNLGCSTVAFEATAVGGPLDEPEVVIPAAGRCSAGRIVVSPRFGVAVPDK